VPDRLSYYTRQVGWRHFGADDGQTTIVTAINEAQSPVASVSPAPEVGPPVYHAPLGERCTPRRFPRYAVRGNGCLQNRRFLENDIVGNIGSFSAALYLRWSGSTRRRTRRERARNVHGYRVHCRCNPGQIRWWSTHRVLHTQDGHGPRRSIDDAFRSATVNMAQWLTNSYDLIPAEAGPGDAENCAARRAGTRRRIPETTIEPAQISFPHFRSRLGQCAVPGGFSIPSSDESVYASHQRLHLFAVTRGGEYCFIPGCGRWSGSGTWRHQEAMTCFGSADTISTSRVTE
jgi:hypothetical protein